ncbi:hypothetical protein [Citrobacter pasteurii]
MKKNNLKNYIDYYITLDTPGFAVLVTGEWGSGKTYQILKAIPTELQCHVSLFGISDANEVYSTVFAKMYPGKNFAKKIIDLTKDVTSEIDGITFGAGTVVNKMLTPLIKQTVDRTKVIIFDDLERCSMENKEILGVINQYIEHHQCRVVILAHDEKIHGDFITTKEKIIGHTIKVTPQIDDAAGVFFQNHYKINNFKHIKPYIIDAFKRTGCQSLRILKYIINDCDRLLNCLEPTHIKHKDAMQSLYTTFCILNIEHRLGEITASDIESISEDYFNYSVSIGQIEDNNQNPSKSQMRQIAFFRKYNEIEIDSKTIDNILLANIFITGNYPAKEITQSLNSSRYFIQMKKNAPWATIINFDHLDDSIIQLAIDEMFENFKEFKIIDIGEMLHSFCLSFMLSEKIAINMDYEELYDFQIKYIDNLLAQDLLPPVSLNLDPFEDDIYERSYSHGYWITKDYENYIDRVMEHLKKCRLASRDKRYPVYVMEILSALESNIDKFKYLLLGNGSEVGLYSQIDILKHIPPDDFIVHWLMLPVKYWDKVRMVLNSRYSGGSYSILRNEKLWLSEICIKLKFEAELYTGLQRHRIERLIPYAGLRSF